MGLADTWRTLGPKGFVSYAASRVLTAVPGAGFHHYRIVAVPRSGMPDMPRDHHWRCLESDAVASAADSLAIPAAALNHRLSQGMACIAAFRDDVLLGCNWLTTAAFDEDEVRVRFVPPLGACWDTGLYIRPEFRAGRAFAAIWAGSAAWMAERGLDWSMSRIAGYNLDSLRSHARMGAMEIGSLTALKLGHRQWLTGGTETLCLRLPEPGQ